MNITTEGLENELEAIWNDEDAMSVDKWIKNKRTSLKMTLLRLTNERSTYKDAHSLSEIAHTALHLRALSNQNKISTRTFVTVAVTEHILDVIELHRLAVRQCGLAELAKCQKLGGEYCRTLIKEAESLIPHGHLQEPLLRNLEYLAAYFLRTEYRISPHLLQKMVCGWINLRTEKEQPNTVLL